MAEAQPREPIHESVHDVRFAQSARVTLQGQMVPTVGVTYYVGQHGPFTDSYDSTTFDHTKAQQGILQRVHGIQQIDTTLPGSPVEKIEPQPPIVIAGTFQEKPAPPVFKVRREPGLPSVTPRQA